VKDREVPVEEITALGAEQEHRLKRTLRRFDLIFFVVASILVIDTLSQVSAGGAETVTWTIVLAIAFVIPYALINTEMGTAFAQEGGPYVWMKLAWGRLLSGIGTTLYWVTNPFWIGGSLAFIATEAWSTNLFEIGTGSAGDYIFKFIFIWICISAAIISLSYGKWIPNIGAMVKVGLIAFFTLTVAIYGIDHGVQSISAQDLSPSVAGFLGVVPLLVFAFVGFELQNSASGEMEDPQRDVPRSVGLGGAIVALCYIVPILAIVLVLPAEEITGLGGFLDTVSTVFGVYGGAEGFMVDLATVAFLITLITSGSTWMIGSDRAQAVASYDGAFFPFFGEFHPKLGTPVRMNVFSGIVATIFMIVAVNLNTSSSAATFAIVLTLAITTTLLSYLLIFPSVIRLRRRYPDVPRPYRVPGGERGLWICTSLATFFVAVGAWTTVFPGTLERLLGLEYPFEEIWGVSQGRYEAFALPTVAIVIIVAIVGYRAAASVRQQPAAMRTTAAAPDALPS
jgi:amino acid transporter